MHKPHLAALFSPQSCWPLRLNRRTW
jgi:hypothetical protein